MTSAHPPFDPRIFHKECLSLVKAGYDVSIICPHDRDESERNIRVISVGRPGGRLRRFSVFPWRIARAALRERSDVYHFHDPDLIPVGLFLKFVARKRVVYDVHEDSSQTILSRHWIPTWARRVLAAVVGRLEKIAARAFDCVVAATPHLKSRFEGCSNVIDVRNYPRLDGYPRRRPCTDREGTFRLVYVGGLEEVRGITQIVRALGFLQDDGLVTLELIGSFTEAAFEAELRRLPEWRFVQYLGRLPYETIPTRLSGASVGLACLHPLPRFVVSYPLKLFEYMAAGIPVVASDFPLWREIVEEAGCGLLVDPLDPQAIAAAVSSLLNDPENARRMGEAGRALAERKYNWKSEERKLLAAYEAIVA